MQKPLKCPPRALSALGVRADRGGDVIVRGISLDSRKMGKDYLFAAFDGSLTHGGKFIARAIAAGANAILTDKAGVNHGGDALEHFRGALIIREDARAAFAHLVARWFDRQGDHMVGVTGTNGKTSSVHFLRQIWQNLGHKAVSIGTNGIEGDFRGSQNITTPDSVSLHTSIAEACINGVTHIAFEASSHGLEQRRCDGISLSAAGFSNLSRDHIDYHASFEAYFMAKARLFTEILGVDAPAVISCDDAWGQRMAKCAQEAGRGVFTISSTAMADLRIMSKRLTRTGQSVLFNYRGTPFQTELNLIGAFQAKNVALAAGLAIAGGEDARDVFAHIGALEGAEGRMQLAAKRANGALVFVDAAHSPDGIATAIAGLRPYVLGRLGIILGAGGERDRGKRALMGRAAQKADFVIVTDDNPRREAPEQIRAQILKACPEALEIGDRAEAILRGIAMLEGGDILLIAGKGAEKNQDIGGVLYPFDDREQASIAVAGLEGRA